MPSQSHSVSSEKPSLASSNMRKFGLPDYWRMFRARGYKLPAKYFIEAHLFDLLHGTETHQWIPKENYGENPDNFEHGTYYMCTWTSEIRYAFNCLYQILGRNFEDYLFIDVGCGKGKVVLVWKKLVIQHGLNQPVKGIDYYAPLIEIANRNQAVVFGRTLAPMFELADATSYDYDNTHDKLILYFYNPFDELVLQKVLKQIENSKNIIIYNNPVHGNVLSDWRYRTIESRMGFHPNACTMIFSNH